MINNSPVQFGMQVGLRISQVAEEAHYLESLGFDFIMAGEHIMRGANPSAMAIPVLSAAAGATTHVRLVTSILLVPLYHPVLLTKLLSIMDRTCGGRLTVGVGVGGEFPEEFEAVGVPVNERGRRTNEALDIMLRLWTQSGVDYAGSYYQFRDVTLNPGPVQAPHPPLWVAGRKEAAMRRAARYGDGWYPYLYSPERLRRSIECVSQYAEQQGRDISQFQWGVQTPIVLDDTPKKAMDVAGRTLRHFFPSSSNWREIVARYCLLGTPDDCANRLAEYIDAGARYFGFQPASDDSRITADMEIVAREIIPKFSGEAGIRRQPSHD